MALLALGVSVFLLLLSGNSMGAPDPNDPGDHFHTCTVSWDRGAGDNSWNNAGNWDRAGVDSLPAPGDHVCIPEHAGSSSVNFGGGNVSVASIESDERVIFSDSTLSLTDTTVLSEFRGGVNFSGGMLAGDADARAHGSSIWNGQNGTGGGGDFIVAPGATLDMYRYGCCYTDLRLNGARDLELQGTLALHDGVDIYHGTLSTARIHVASGGTLVKKDNTDTSSIHVPLDNDGTVTSDFYYLTVNGGGLSAGVFTAPGDEERDPDTNAITRERAFVVFEGGDNHLDDETLLDGGATGRGVYMTGGNLFTSGPDNQVQVANGSTFRLTGGTVRGDADDTATTDEGDMAFVAENPVADNEPPAVVQWAAQYSLGDRGQLTIGEGVTLRVETHGCCYSDHHLQGTRSITNEGRLELMGHNDIQRDTSTPAITNAAGGVIAKRGGDYSDISVPVHNGSGGTVTSLDGFLRLFGGGTGSGAYRARGSAGEGEPAAYLELHGGSFAFGDSALISGGATGKGFAIHGGTITASGTTSTIHFDDGTDVPLYGGNFEGDIKLAARAPEGEETSTAATLQWRAQRSLGTTGQLTITPSFSLDIFQHGCCYEEHYLSGTRTIENLGTVELHEGADIYRDAGSTASIHNATNALFVKVNEQGADVNDSTLHLPLHNDGTARSDITTLTLQGGGTSNGLFTARGTALLNEDGSVQSPAAYIGFSAGDHRLSDDALIDGGASGAGVYMNGGNLYTFGEQNHLQLTNRTVFRLTGGVLKGDEHDTETTNPGDMTIVAEEPADTSRPSFEWAASYSLGNAGDLRIGEDVTMQVETYGCCYGDHYLEGSRTITNEGRLEFVGHNDIYRNNSVSKVINADSGVVAKIGGDATDIDVPLDNRVGGLVTSQDGTLRLYEGGDGAGTYRARGPGGDGEPTASLQLHAGSFSFTDAALLSGGATGSGFEIHGGTVTATGATETIHLEDGTTIPLYGGNLQGDITLTSQGSDEENSATLAWRATRSLGDAGRLTIAPDMTLDVFHYGCCYDDHYLTGSRTIENLGTIELHDGADLYRDGGSTARIHNASGALMAKVNESDWDDDDSTISIPLDNDGMVRSDIRTLGIQGGGTSSGVFTARGSQVLNPDNSLQIPAAYVAFQSGDNKLTDEALLDGGVTGQGVHMSGGNLHTVGPNNHVRLTNRTTFRLTGGVLKGDEDDTESTNVGDMTFVAEEPASDTAPRPVLEWAASNSLGNAGDLTIGADVTLRTAIYGCCYHDHRLEGTRSIVNRGLIQVGGDNYITPHGSNPSTVINTSTGTFEKTGGGTSYVHTPLHNREGGVVRAQNGILRLQGGGSGDGLYEARGAAGDGEPQAHVVFQGGIFDISDSALLSGGASHNGIGIEGGSIRAVGPSRTIHLDDETSVSFSGGTLAGHPESGDIRFAPVEGGTAEMSWRQQWGLGNKGVLTFAEGFTFKPGLYGCCYWDHYMDGTRRINNEGTIDFTGDADLVRSGTGATIYNAPGGTITAHLSAAGTLSDIHVPTTNDGTLRPELGTLRLMSGGGGSGSFGGDDDGSNSGITRFVNGTFDLEEGAEFLGRVAIDGGTVELSEGLELHASRLQQTGGTVAGSGDLVVDGSFDWSDGAWSGLGRMRVGPDATLNVAPSGCCGDVFQTDRALKNEGTTIFHHGTWYATGTTIRNSGSFEFRGGTLNKNGSDSVLHNVGTLRKVANNDSWVYIAVDNDGRIRAEEGQLFLWGRILNYSGSQKVLTSGDSFMTANLRMNNVDIRTNATTLRFQGSGANCYNGWGGSCIQNLARNARAGRLRFMDKNFTSSGAFKNEGKLIVDGTSTFASNGAFTQTSGATRLPALTSVLSTVSGNFDLLRGELSGTGTVDANVVQSAGRVGPAAQGIGALRIDGNFSQTPVAGAKVKPRLIIDVDATGNDVLQVIGGGTAMLDGVLEIRFAQGFTPAAGQTFRVVEAASVSGSFSSIKGLDLPSDLDYEIVQDAGGVSLELVSSTVSSTDRPVGTDGPRSAGSAGLKARTNDREREQISEPLESPVATGTQSRSTKRGS